MDTLTIVLYTSVLVLVLRFIYRYLMEPFTYWEKRGIKSAPAWPIIGSLHEIFNQDVHKVLLNRYRKYGRIHGFYEANRPVLAIAEPELLKDIFVRDFHIFPNRRNFSTGTPVMEKMISGLKGEEWKRVRAVLTPAFSSGKIKKKSSIIADAANITLSKFEKYVESGQPVDCKRIFGTFTLDVIGRTAFGTKVDPYDDPENEILKCVRRTFETGITFKLFIFFLMPKLSRLFRMSIFPLEVVHFFQATTLGIIKQRRETGKKYDDLLQLLMDAADEVVKDEVAASNEETVEDESEKVINDLGHEHQNKQMFKITKKNKRVSQDELVAQCILFLLAGYDSASSTLSFACYLLALNPECQETLIREVDETLKKNQGKFTHDAIQSMKYLHNVISETLRMFPPVIGTDREALEDYELGSTGIKITKGMIVTIPIYGMHYDPEFYEEPEKFNPDRFNPEVKDQRHPYSFLPFGAGPRNCVGMRLGLIEVKFCLATFLSKFRVMRCAETKVPPEFFFGQGLLQPKPILLRVEKRNDGVV